MNEMLSWLFSENFYVTNSLLLFGVISLAVIHSWYSKSRNLLPGPWGIPLLGILPSLGKYPERTLRKYSETYGPIISVRMATMDTVVLNDYDSIHQALVKQASKFSGRLTLSWLDDILKKSGVETIDHGPFLKSQRKVGLTTLRGFGMGKQSMEERVIEEAAYFNEKIRSQNGKAFDISKKLGNFVMGDISKGRLIGSGKVLIHTITWGTVQNTLLEKALESLKEIQHKNIAKIYGVVFQIVTEYLCNGNLQDYFRSKLGLESVYRHHLSMAAQVASGMAYLEANSVIHGDLRGENILVGQNNLCKISGINLTTLCVNSGGFPFLPAWSAPKVQDTKNFTHKSDVWSFRILLYVIFTKRDSPYPGIKRHEVLDKVRGGYRMSKPVTNPPFPDDVFHTMRDCWHISDVMRPKFRFLMDFLKKCLTDYDCGKAEDEHIYEQI